MAAFSGTVFLQRSIHEEESWFFSGGCILLGLLICGCGQEAEDYTVGSASLEYYDISAEKEELFEGLKEDEENGFLLGMQYYQGELIQIWLLYGEENNNVYLCRTDGSRELLQEDAHAEDIARWYLDEDSRELFRKQLEQGVLLFH